MEDFVGEIESARFHQDVPKLVSLFQSQSARHFTKEQLQSYKVNICQRSVNDDFTIAVGNSPLERLINHLLCACMSKSPPPADLMRCIT